MGNKVKTINVHGNTTFPIADQDWCLLALCYWTGAADLGLSQKHQAPMIQV